MDKKNFYKMLDETFELSQGTIKGHESLSDSFLIDSLSMLGLISLLDKQFEVQIGPKQIVQAGTVDNLFHLICNNKI